MCDEDIVCANCGAAVRHTANSQEPAKKVVGVWGYIWRYLLLFVPVVGQILYLIFLFVAAFGKDKEESFRNWAKAQLLIMAIGLGITLIFVVLWIVLALVGGIGIAQMSTPIMDNAVAGGIMY